jgi:hypothetical protein
MLTGVCALESENLPDLNTKFDRTGFEPKSDYVKSLFLCCIFTVNLKSRLLLKQLKEPLKAMSEQSSRKLENRRNVEVM